MNITTLVEIWSRYKSFEVDMTIHPLDVMYNSAVKKPDDYQYCGNAAAEVIFSALSTAPTPHVRRILDFGCGYGRVGRYLRAMFPHAEITFADVEESAIEFCANKFRGKALKTTEDFKDLIFDQKYDLIWLGSVFTHIDYERMKILFSALFGALESEGLLVGTFRGEKMYQSYKRNPEVAERDKELLREYEHHGIAYARYPGWKSDWGLSLVMPQKLVELGQRTPEARLVQYTEVGWASAHDVVAWTNTSPLTHIR